MRVALHPTRNEQITYVGYIKECGHRPVLGEDVRPRARCPFCGQHLTDVAGRTDKTVGHFSHLPRSGFCASKEPAGRPYLVLTPVDPDPEHGRQLKEVFLNKWEHFYLKVGDLVPFLSIEEFFGLVAEATRLRVWEYRHLEAWEIPYALVLMVDFPATTSIRKNGKPQRIFWFRFWYDSTVRTLDDLWIRRHDEPVLFRASYVQPRRSGVIPNFDEIVKFYPLPREREYLDALIDTSQLPEWLPPKVSKRLPRMLGLRE